MIGGCSESCYKTDSNFYYNYLISVSSSDRNLKLTLKRFEVSSLYLGVENILLYITGKSTKQKSNVNNSKS